MLLRTQNNWLRANEVKKKRNYQYTSLEVECHSASSTRNNRSGQLHEISGRHSLENATKQFKGSMADRDENNLMDQCLETFEFKLNPYLWFLLLVASLLRWSLDTWDIGNPARTCGGSTANTGNQKEWPSSISLHLCFTKLTRSYVF